MIPILFNATETAFTSNGIGRLVDAIECTVTEERNGEYELFLQYPVTGRYFKQLAYSKIIGAIPADGKALQPFRIYRIDKPISGKCDIYAEHISYQLSFIPVMPFTLQNSNVGAALNALKTYSAESNPFSIWTDKTTTGSYTVTEPQSFRALLGGVSGSILDVFGTGEYEFDKYTVKLHAARGNDNGVVIRYGKNLVDVDQDENIENTITGICPFWKDSETGAVVTLPEKVLWSDNASNYPYKRTRVVDFTERFEDEPTEAQLRAAGQSYIQNNNIGVPRVSLAVEFVPLWQVSGAGMEDYHSLERVNLCDTITVIFERLGVSAKAKVIKTVYNVLKGRYDSLEIGDARVTLDDIITNTANTAAESVASDSISSLQRYVIHQTELITGGLGGYVVLNPNADGEPQEILIMDTDNIETAVNVIRMNKNGIGYSNNGYSGPYVSAWTIDGVFNASVIGAGSMDAAYITAGSITATQIASGAVTADKIQAGAITVAKLSNEVSTSISTAQSTADGAVTAAGAAQTTANGANYKEQLIYISKASGTTSVSANTTWVTDATGSQNDWTTKRPAYDQSYPVLFVATQRQTVSQSSGSTCTCTTPAIDETTTVIDGGNVITGTITAGKIAAGAVTVNKLSLSGQIGVYTDSTLVTNGGYIGYMSGSTGYETTTGIAMMNSLSSNFAMVTSAGVKLFNGSVAGSEVQSELYISGGHLVFRGSYSNFAGNVYLNRGSTSGWADLSTWEGTTYCNTFYSYDAIGLLDSGGYNRAGIKIASGYSSLYVNNSLGNTRVKAGDGESGGYVRAYNASGYSNFLLTATTDGGSLYLFDSTGTQRGVFYCSSSGSFLNLTDSSGNNAYLNYADIIKLHNL